MAESSQKLTVEKPKSILKQTSSNDDHSFSKAQLIAHSPVTTSEVHFDEMNILQTYHPANKDYGHMKIEEPPTPYNYQNQDSEDEDHTLDPQQLAIKMKSVTSHGKTSTTPEHDSDSDEEMSPEQQQMKKEFKDKRKHHYNEYVNVKLARELIAKELAELEDEGS